MKRGKIRADEAGQMPFKNAVTRAVGVYEKVEVDAFDIDVMRGDQYLLCSDGLSGYLDEDEGALLKMAVGETKTIPDAYIRFANEQCGKDNITAIFVRVTEAAPSVPKIQPSEAPVPETDSPYMHALRMEPLFSHCAYSDLRKLSDLVQEHHLKRGDTLCEANECLDGLYICLEGALQIDGDTRKLEKGGSIGMEALLSSIRYERAITASEDVRLLYIPGASLRRVMTIDQNFGWRLLFSLGEQQSKQICADVRVSSIRSDARRNGVVTSDSGAIARRA